MRKVIEQYLTISRFNRPGVKLNTVKGIVVHYTANANANAEQNIKFWERRKDGTLGYGAAHFVVDSNETRIAVPINELAYHVGANEYKKDALDRLGSYPNNSTIGVELCNINDAGGFHAQTEESGAELIANLLYTHNLTINDLWRHYDITGKICPKIFVENEESYHKFKDKVKSYLDRLSK